MSIENATIWWPFAPIHIWYVCWVSLEPYLKSFHRRFTRFKFYWQISLTSYTKRSSDGRVFYGESQISAQCNSNKTPQKYCVFFVVFCDKICKYVILKITDFFSRWFLFWWLFFSKITNLVIFTILRGFRMEKTITKYH